MGNTSVAEKAEKADLSEYSALTNFSEEVLRDWYIEFQIEANKDGRWSYQIFKRMFYTMYAILVEDIHINRVSLIVFKSITGDQKRYIDFQEFIVWLSMMTHGTDRERLVQIFHIFDLDKNGFLTRNELFGLLKSVDKLNGVLSEESVFERVDKLIKHSDSNRDDKITFTEFLSAAKLEPIAEMFKDRHRPFEREVESEDDETFHEALQF